MTISWTKLVLPANKTFADELYSFLATFESVKLNPYPIGKNNNITIGVGFDLKAGGSVVQNAVFEAMGFADNVVNANTSASVQKLTKAELTDYGYVQQLRSAITVGGQAGVAQLNAVMAARANYYSISSNTDPGYAAYINSIDANGPQTTFSFSSNNVVESVFNNLWASYYEIELLNVCPELKGTSFIGSQEEIALGSLIWTGGTGLIGKHLQAAIASGNRSEAWFEIRYDSNGGQYQQATAKRRYCEAAMFGLYSDPNNVTQAEALQVYRMATKHTIYKLLSYDAQHARGFNLSQNITYPSGTNVTKPEDLVTSLTPAAQELFSLYGFGNNQVFDPLNIFVEGLRSNESMAAPNLENGPALLIAGDGADTLSGGRGNDVLFSGTVYDNLQMANPHATFDDIVRACRMAEIHEAIERLPQGYQTEIGERGAGLSGGQKQRIAIARALLKRPKVLLFDEATSSLDAQTSEHFAATINQLKGQMTMLFITHALPKNLQVDEVVRIGSQATPQPPADQLRAFEIESRTTA